MITEHEKLMLKSKLDQVVDYIDYLNNFDCRALEMASPQEQSFIAAINNASLWLPFVETYEEKDKL